MEKDKQEYPSIDEYIHSFPEPIQKKLMELREAIKEQAPEAQEKISYQMPTFFFKRKSGSFCGTFKTYRFLPNAKRH